MDIEDFRNLIIGKTVADLTTPTGWQPNSKFIISFTDDTIVELEADTFEPFAGAHMNVSDRTKYDDKS